MKMPGTNGDVTVSADLDRGEATGTVMLAASPEHVFRALTTDEICKWWARPGVFDTRKWRGDVRVGGTWEAEGMGNGRPYRLEGRFVEVSPQRKLMHTWIAVGGPSAETIVTYVLQPVGDGTRVDLTHSGFSVPEVCAVTAAGWGTSFQHLSDLLTAEGR